MKQDKLEFIIEVSSKQAQKELQKLEKQMNGLELAQASLDKGTKEYASNAKQIDAVREKMAKLANQIESGNVESYARLQKAARAIEKEMLKLTKGNDDYIAASENLAQVKARMAEIKAEIKATGTEAEKTANSVADIGEAGAKGGGKIEGFFGGMKEELMGMAPLGAAAVGAVAVEKVIEFGTASVESFNAAENAAFRLHKSIVENGGESEEAYQRLIEQAGALEATTVGFSKTQILAAQAALKIQGLHADEIEVLLPKILDFAAANKIELSTAIEAVGGAMRGEMDSAENYGLNLDKNTLSVGSLAKGLDKFKGTATDAMRVGTNATEQFAEGWEKVKVGVGGFLVGAGNQLLEWLLPVGLALKELWNVLSYVYEAYVSLVSPIANFVNGLATTYPWIGKIVAALKEFANPFHFIINALQSVAEALRVFVGGSVATFATLKQIYNEFGTYASNIFSNLGNAITSLFSGNFTAAGLSFDAMKKAFSDAGSDIATTFRSNYDKAMKDFAIAPDTKSDFTPKEITTDRKLGPAIDADNKAAEKAAKEAEKEEKAAQKARLQAQKEGHKLYADNEKELAKAKIDQMEKGLDKEKAIIRQNLKEELHEIAEKEKSVRDNEHLTKAEKMGLLEQYSQMRKEKELASAKELLSIEDKYNKERQAFREKFIELEISLDKRAEKAKLDNIKDALECKKAEILAKKAEEIKELEKLESAANENEGASIAEKTALQGKFSQAKMDIAQKAANDIKQLEAQAANDKNQALLKIEEDKQAQIRSLIKATLDWEVLEAEKSKDDARIYAAHRNRLLNEKKLAIELAEDKGEAVLAIDAEYDTKLEKLDADRLKKLHELEIRDLRAKNDIEIIQAGDNNAKLIAAKIARLDLEMKIELENADLIESEKAAIVAKYEQEKKALHKETADKQKDLDAEVKAAMMDLMQAGFDAFNAFADMQVEKDLSANEKSKNSKIKNLDAALKGNKISQEKYDKEKAKIEAEHDKKEKAIMREKAQREKAFAIISATINAAAATMKALNSFPGPPATIPLAVATGVIGALQIATISAQPIPQLAKGGLLAGPSHAEGGLKILNPKNNNIIGELEGDEAVLSKATVQNNPTLVHALLRASMYGNGAKIPLFANGGILSNMPILKKIDSSTGQTVINHTQENVDLGAVLKKIDMLNDTMSGVLAYLVDKELLDDFKMMIEIEKKAGRR